MTEPLAFYQNVSPTKELRDASNEAESEVRNFGVEASMRLDVFNAKIAAEKNIKASGQWDKLTPEDQRLIEKMVCILLVDFTVSCARITCHRFSTVHALVLLYQKTRGQN